MNQKVRTLFQELVDLSPGDRERVLAERQIGPQDRAEIESLLSFDAANLQSLTDCVADAAQKVLNSTNRPPSLACGPYRLVQLLGSGGMGAVYLGERKDGEIRQKVAVKLLRADEHRPEWRTRFLKERQLLASLNHPSIVHMIDAGHTADGRPYLVMEYVDGIPIDAYAAGLEVRELLALFLDVCAGVSHAHRHLIIHRDLKPSNILVDAPGQPKVLDFGIGKLLDETGDATQTIERLLTPSYASPEQLRGTIQTTATDVYSLGAVLYKLLTGRLPREPEPAAAPGPGAIPAPNAITPPSHLNENVPTDLDYVSRKALRPEPEERYASVEAFADDLRAVLESRPVKARSADTWYRTRKFARRHWLPVSAVVAAILSLCTGLYIASREKSVAQRRFAQLRLLSNRVLELDGAIRGLPGSTKAREQIVSVSKEYLDGLSREARNDPNLKLDAARGYMLTALVQGVPIWASMGKLAEAEVSLATAAGLAESVLATAPDRTDALLLAAEIEGDRMIVADTQHDWPKAQRLAERSSGYAGRLQMHGYLRPEQNQILAAVYNRIGQAEMNIHRYAEAPAFIRRGLELSRASGASSGTVAQSLSLLANALRQAGDLEGALQSIDAACAMADKAEFASETQRVTALYAIWWRRGVILGEDESVSLGRADEAAEAFEKAFRLMDAMASKDANDTSYRDKAASAGQQLGDVLRHTDPSRALAIYDLTLQRVREMKGSGSARMKTARLLANSSYPLRTLHRMAEARQRIDEAFQILRDDPAVVGIIGGEWDAAMRASADYESELGHPERARGILLELQEKLLALHPNPESDLRHANDMSRLYESLVHVDAALGKVEEQNAFEKQRMDLWRHWDQELPHNPFIQGQLGKVPFVTSSHSGPLSTPVRRSR